MKNLLSVLIILLFPACWVNAKDPATSDQAPRWLHLGDDADLKKTFQEAEQVVVICIFKTVLEEVDPPFATVVHNATVVRSLKGNLKVGDKIEVAFRTDSLPGDEAERAKFVAKADESAAGDLRFGFIFGHKGKRHEVEWLDLPDYSKAMDDFLTPMAAGSGKER